MWSAGVVVLLPSLQLPTRILHCDELMDVQELVAQPTIERLDQPVVRGFPRPCVVELDTTPTKLKHPTALDVNSVPLSIVIVLGQPRSIATSSSASPTHQPVSRKLVAKSILLATPLIYHG